MVHHTRTQSWWTVKNPQENNNTYDNERDKLGLRRTYSEETDLSESGKFSGTSSGDESWSDMSPSSGKTKLSREAGLFVPQQPVQASGEQQPQRTKLSSNASVFVPGQMASQMAPNFTPQLPQTSPLFMPQMMPMDQGMPCMAPCYYMAPAAPDGCYYNVMVPDGSMMCPVAMPVISGESQPPAALEASTVKTEEHVMKAGKMPLNERRKDSLVEPSKKRWADLEDDDDSEDPWLQ